MDKKLRAAREAAAKAREAAAERWEALEQARAALASADDRDGVAIKDTDEYKAAMTAKDAYDTAASDADDADRTVAELVALSTDDAPAPFAGAPAVHTAERGSDETGGFKNLGEFIHAVRFNPGTLAGRGIEYRAEQSVGSDTEGGYLVPDAFTKQILELPTSRQIVRPRATVIPAGGEPDAKLEIPALNQAGAGNMFGGVEVFWEDDESDTDVSETGAAFAPNVSVQSKSARAFITVTNKLMRNAGWATPVFQRLLGSAYINAEDFAFISGDGNGKPTGVRSSTGMTYVNRQVADKVVWEDVLAMKAALHPDCADNAVFLASQALYPQLRDLKDANGERVYFVGDPTKGISDSLDGIPVIYTGKVGAPGAKGDLILVDFSYYLIKDGQEMLISTSEHVKFLKDRTVIKINRSVDGKGWVTAPLTLEDGETTVAPYVGLDVPAIP